MSPATLMLEFIRGDNCITINVAENAGLRVTRWPSLVWALLAALVLYGYSAAAAAVTRVATFDTDTPGFVLTDEYLSSHGIRFPNGVAVLADPVSGAGNNVIQPLPAGEFDREQITASFSLPQNTVSLQVKEDPTDHSGTFGQEILITMTAWAISEYTDPFGGVIRTPVVVDSDVVRFTSGDRTLATLSTNASVSFGIEWINVTMTLGGVENNLYLLADWLQIEGDSAPPPLPDDDESPVVSIHANVITNSRNSIYRLDVTDNRQIASITFSITHVDTAVSFVKEVCGTAVTGVCPATEYHEASEGSYWDGGLYELYALACDSSGNCADDVHSIFFDAPDPPPEPPTVSSWRLEINQGVQSQLNNIASIPPGSFGTANAGGPYVPGKDTVVRWYLLADGADRPNYTADMQVIVGYNDGTESRTTLSPNNGSSADVPEDPGDAAARNELLRGVVRPDLSRSLNFVIPRGLMMLAETGEPVADWRVATRLQIRLIGVTGRITVPISAPVYLGLHIYRLSGPGIGPEPTDVEINRDILSTYMKTALPVAPVAVLSRRSYPWGGRLAARDNDCESILRSLWWDFVGDSPGASLEGPAHTSTLAVITTSSDGCTGKGERPGGIAVTRVLSDTSAHEVSHNIGLSHIGGSHGEAGWVPWPYPHGSVDFDDYGIIPQYLRPGQYNLILIDPCPNGNPDLSDRIPCTVDGDGDGTPEDRQATHDLMGYGAGTEQIPWRNNGNTDRWPSKLTYNQLYEAIMTGNLSWPYDLDTNDALSSDAAVITTTAASAEPERNDSLMIGGSVLDDGQISLMPLMRKMLPEQTPDNPTGRYHLQLFDKDGLVLSELQFDPTRTGDNDKLIQLIIPWVDGINRLLITDGDEVVADQSASPNTPTVQVLAPNGGEIFAKGVTTVRWIGGDADGDEVIYMIQYSPDGGVSWQGLGHRKAEEGKGEISFDTNEYIPGRKGLIRIIATDGMNIAIDDSDRAFTVGTDELPIGFAKLQTEGDDSTGIALPAPSEFAFRISYANPEQETAVRILDTVPAEFEVIDVQADAGSTDFFPANAVIKKNSATKIVWDLAANETEGTLQVWIRTVATPNKKLPPVYKPMRCGTLSLNDGAVVVAVDAAGNEIPGSNIYPQTNSLSIMAVAGAEPCDGLF